MVFDSSVSSTQGSSFLRPEYPAGGHAQRKLTEAVYDGKELK